MATATGRTDLELLADYFGSGDQGAFSELHQRWSTILFRWIKKKFYLDVDSANDICQEAWIIAGRSANNLTGQFKSWLFTVAKRQAQYYLRIRGRFARNVPVDTIQRDAAIFACDRSPTPEQECMAAERLQCVTLAVSNLQSDHLAMLRTVFAVGQTYRGAGEQLGTSGGTLHYRVQKVLHNLRQECASVA